MWPPVCWAQCAYGRAIINFNLFFIGGGVWGAQVKIIKFKLKLYLTSCQVLERSGALEIDWDR